MDRATDTRYAVVLAAVKLLGNITSSAAPRGKRMEVENYFEFLAPDDIRLKGTWIGIETILYEYRHRAIASNFLCSENQSVINITFFMIYI